VARQWFTDGDIVALLPLGGPQGNSVALVWSVQEQRADELLALAPEAFVQRLQAICGDAVGQLALVSDRAAWPLQRAMADRNVHPLAGQGLNLGLGDAEALAQVLHGREYWRGLGDPKLLRRYERARKTEVLAMGWMTDGLQQLFAQPAEPWSWVRNWGMRGFDRSGPLKHWMARQAMGGAQNLLRTGK
jgi:2-polyprenyl-6-methoxyphenol hydroxylase-like FAD-dependent oxidoreductase